MFNLSFKLDSYSNLMIIYILNWYNIKNLVSVSLTDRLNQS